MKMKDYRVAESMEHILEGKVEHLSSEDLLAVFLGSREKAENILSPEPELFSRQALGLSGLVRMSVDDLMYWGLSRDSAIKLAASLELAKRAVNVSEIGAHITSPGDGARYLEKLQYYPTEVFVCLLLNTKNRVTKEILIAKGSLSSAVVHPREVYAPAVAAHAASILVAHNHPSFDPTPSQEDRNLTRALEEAGSILSIPLIDHIIIGSSNNYYSFKQNGDL